ncbi:cell envelope integrity protein TolA [Microvirga flavescens]|uniref:cell envelope integrity protein TolA n=1 Tax=Microvirga flavescens TaxID=2249811 RepID=UPI000DD8A4A8|nr:cell envelope integrity protein TolA [Microvirga flavescens]
MRFPSRSLLRLAALLTVMVVAPLAPGLAQGVSPFGDEEEGKTPYDLSPKLPESINGVIRPGEGLKDGRIDTLNDVFRVIQSCWRPPRNSGFSGQEITVLLSFKRNGELLGKPRITFYKSGGDADQRDAFQRSVLEAFARCTPLPVTEKLGSAIAGRPFTFRFADTRPM